MPKGASFVRRFSSDRHRWQTIGAHIVLLVTIQLVLVLGLITFAGTQDYRVARERAAGEADRAAVLAAGYVAQEVRDSAAELDQIPQFADLLASPAVCQFTSGDQQEGWNDSGLTSQFLLLSTAGTSICPLPEGSPDFDFGRAGWFRQAVATGEPVEAEPYFNPSTRKLTTVNAVALPDFDTVVAIATDLSSIGPALGEEFANVARSVEFTVLSSDRSIEVGSSDGGSGRRLSGSVFAEPVPDGGTTGKDLGGVHRIYGEAQVPELGWHVVAGVATKDALAEAQRSFRERVIFAAVMVLIVIAAAAFLQRRFVRPIRSLARATGKASAGDLNAKVTPEGPSELRELGEGFNEMLEVRKDAEAALKKAYRTERKAADELREIDGMRNAFLMAISHELRTPLTSVVGYATFLEDEMGDLPPDQIETSIKAIAGQSKRLERLLLDLLDVERLSRGIVEPNAADTDVKSMVLNVIERSNGARRIRADVKKDVQAEIDPALTERMLENLVFNAVKHTPPNAKIWVRASRDNGTLRLSVEDSGNGVPDELKTAIFEPFKQGKVPEHAPGTGVGLSLVSQFAKLQGGKAWVEDRRGGGAAFRIELPAKSSKRLKLAA